MDAISTERSVFSNLHGFGLEVSWKKRIGNRIGGIADSGG